MVGGYEAQYLDGIAERTFKDLLASWIGPKYPGPSRIDADLQKIDITHQMPSLSRDLGSIPFRWRIIAQSQPPRETVSLILGCRCFRLDVGKSYVRDLIDLSLHAPSFYLALAIENRPGDPSLPDHPPADRFRWYVIDLKQYCRKLDWGDPPSCIDIPTHNHLNLLLFSLIWAGNWVSSYLAPLHREISDKPAVVSRLVDSLHIDIDKIGTLTSIYLAEAVPKLDALSGILDRNAFNEYTSRLAIVGSLRGVSAMLHASRGADLIETYSPEALAGSANLWLFSRSYHEFMRVTQIIGRKNKRLLPVAYDNLVSIPRFFLGTLLNVRALYRAIGAEVHLVRVLKEEGNYDHAYYSGAIGSFRWVQVDSDGHITLNHNHLSARPSDLELLRFAEEGLLVGGGPSLSRSGDYGSPRLEDLRLVPVKPVCLFPQEDHLLEHPSELWGSHRYSVLPF
jgi:hypothetical protein